VGDDKYMKQCDFLYTPYRLERSSFIQWIHTSVSDGVCGICGRIHPLPRFGTATLRPVIIDFSGDNRGCRKNLVADHHGETEYVGQDNSSGE
jgi:hypothetical protein